MNWAPYINRPKRYGSNESINLNWGLFKFQVSGYFKGCGYKSASIINHIATDVYSAQTYHGGRGVKVAFFLIEILIYGKSLMKTKKWQNFANKLQILLKIPQTNSQILDKNREIIFRKYF